MVWAIVLSVFLLIVAILIAQWVFLVVEDENHFLYIVGAFFVVFIAATTLCFWLLPDLRGGANIAQLVQAWVEPGTRVQAEGPDNLPLLE